MWADNSYVYVYTSSGLDIYDIISEEKYAYITYSGGFNTVWANNDKLFLGTNASGIKYINKTCISGSVSSPIDLYTCLENFSNLTPYYVLTSNNIQYIHGNDDLLGIVTNSGLDVVKLNPQSYRSCTLISGAKKCFMTSTGKFYYIIDDDNSSRVCCIYTSLVDWSEPDKCFIPGSGVLASGIALNDLFILEGTATNNYNTICLATTSGVYLIDENSNEYNLYYIE